MRVSGPFTSMELLILGKKSLNLTEMKSDISYVDFNVAINASATLRINSDTLLNGSNIYVLGQLRFADKLTLISGSSLDLAVTGSTFGSNQGSNRDNSN